MRDKLAASKHRKQLQRNAKVKHFRITGCHSFSSGNTRNRRADPNDFITPTSKRTVADNAPDRIRRSHYKRPGVPRSPVKEIVSDRNTVSNESPKS